MAEIVKAKVWKFINYLDLTLFFDPRFAQRKQHLPGKGQITASLRSDDLTGITWKR
jgi:hypothetical protein